MGIFRDLLPTKIKQQTASEYNELLFKNLTKVLGLPDGQNKKNLIESGYQKNATVYSIVNYIINASLVIPAKVYEVTDRGALKDYKSLTSGSFGDTTIGKAYNSRHRALKPSFDSNLQKVMDNPNPDMGYAQFMSEIIGFFELTGDTYMQGVSPSTGTNAGRIGQLYPLPAHLMEIIIGEDINNPIEGYQIKYFDYRSDSKLPYDQVAHVKTFNPDYQVDGSHLYGQSPLTAAMRNLTINNESIDTGRNFLKNQGVRGVLSSDDMGMLTKEQVSQLKDAYKAKYQGSDNAGDIMITNHMFKWINMGLPASDVALIEQYNLSKKDIAAAYNFPSLLLNDTAEFSVSTYREAKKQLYLQRIIPDLCLIRDELNRWLTPTYNSNGKEYYIDFDYTTVPELQEDMEKVTKQLNVSYWQTPNEKRIAQGLDPLEKEGMDDVYIPANLINMSMDAIAGEDEGGNPIQRLYDASSRLDKLTKAETYTDYPQSATNNAKRALKYKKENNPDCGTSVGWTRARQLANRQGLSRDTIARMASFKRHQQHSDVPYSEGCGGLMWDAWGGTSGIEWAIRKLKEIDKE